MELEELNSWRSLVLLSMFVVFLIWETVLPFFPMFRGQLKQRVKHGFVNILVAVIHILITRFAFVVLWLLVCRWANERDFGLLNWLDLPTASRLIAVVLCLDLYMYWWHRINHEVPFFWRFHRMHHSDLQMDVTTANRFHLGEIVMSSILRLGLFALLGVQFWEVVFYEMIMAVVVLFHHANIGLPKKVDAFFRLLIPTPHLHKIHHSKIRRETNSNYGSLLSVWDRLFISFRTVPDLRRIDFGLNEFVMPRQQSFLYLLKMPFLNVEQARPQQLHDVEKYTDHAADYAKYRPNYPPTITQHLKKTCELNEYSVVVDVASGTGISSKLFLKLGCKVYGIEPNEAMRRIAEESLQRYPDFVSVAGNSAETTLPDDSADFVVAAQALQWFDRSLAKEEFKRVLKDNGWVVLIWNQRLTRSGLEKEYELLMRDAIPNYGSGKVERIDDMLKQFLDRDVSHETFPNFHVVDYEGLMGKARSNPEFPLPRDPKYNEFMQQLREIFERHNNQGKLSFEYKAHVYIGRFEPQSIPES